MDFIANIIPGAKGASGSGPKAGKTGADDNTPFAALVSTGDPEELAAASKTNDELQEGLIPAASALPSLIMGETGFASKGENSAATGLAKVQVEAGGLESALLVKGMSDLAGTAPGGKDSRMIIARQQAGSSLQGQGGPAPEGKEPLANKLPGFGAQFVDKAGARAAEGATSQPGEITAKAQIEAALQGGLIAAKAAMAKSPGAKTGLHLKAAPDMMNPAGQALAAFAKMSRGVAAKAAPELAAAKIDGADAAKPAESRASSLSFESPLNISADRSQISQTLLQSHPVNAKSGALPVNAVAIEIARKFSSGSNRFQIRLDPPELGRIDVRMDVSKEGHVKAHLIVEKPETLAALNRDAAALERALNASGLETRENGLNFSLSGGNHSFDGDEKTGRSAAGDDADIVGGHENETFSVDRTMRGYISASGVDIHV